MKPNKFNKQFKLLENIIQAQDKIVKPIYSPDDMKEIEEEAPDHTACYSDEARWSAEIDYIDELCRGIDL